MIDELNGIQDTLSKILKVLIDNAKELEKAPKVLKKAHKK